MVTIPFNDFIVNATDLRRNQKTLLEKALKTPVTIQYGKKMLTIINREELANLTNELFWADVAVKTCRQIAGKKASDQLVWLENLSQPEKEEFQEELLNAFVKALSSNNWEDIRDMYEDWIATAQAKSSPDLRAALTEKERQKDYVEIK